MQASLRRIDSKIILELKLNLKEIYISQRPKWLKDDVKKVQIVFVYEPKLLPWRHNLKSIVKTFFIATDAAMMQMDTCARTH